MSTARCGSYRRKREGPIDERETMGVRHRSKPGVRFALAALASALAMGSAPHSTDAARASSSAETGSRLGGCTMTIPPMHATVEAQMAFADDFCEIMSQALAGEVFRSSVVVTPSQLWHYRDAVISCRLRYADSPARITVRNSPRACSWLSRAATGWHLDTITLTYAARP
jgi:hypothetical protein